MDTIPSYTEAESDQCVTPDDDDSMVCGYVYDSSSTTCEGRNYEIQTFPTAGDATIASAAIVHQGGKKKQMLSLSLLFYILRSNCSSLFFFQSFHYISISNNQTNKQTNNTKIACGVCSSAQDFGTRIKTYGSLEIESIKCATSFTFSQNFPKLITCYSDLGFTESCATLWAHFAATNSKTCAIKCFPTADGVIVRNIYIYIYLYIFDLCDCMFDAFYLSSCRSAFSYYL
jgi:hypothetical protein